MSEQESGHPGETRLPAALAVAGAILLYAVLPSAMQLGPRFVVPVLELVLFVPLVLANPRRMSRQNRFLRRLSIALVLLIAVTNLAALVQLIHSLVTGEATAGGQLLAAAGQVWLTNVLVFALAFWELDRGGPVSRFRVRLRRLPVCLDHQLVGLQPDGHDAAHPAGKALDGGGIRVGVDDLGPRRRLRSRTAEVGQLTTAW
ncbi:hypothetical protein [Kribbella sp. NPDC051620]|uniref:hypothetical protein n=1 Tax=Kribbella sp. NPDC051620 TaxID=3364120 RepID=UPI00378D538D